MQIDLHLHSVKVISWATLRRYQMEDSVLDFVFALQENHVMLMATLHLVRNVMLVARYFAICTKRNPGDYMVNIPNKFRWNCDFTKADSPFHQVCVSKKK